MKKHKRQDRRQQPQEETHVRAIETPVQFRCMEINPVLAKKWLDRNNEAQRNLSWSRVEAFANDMRGGNWKLTHQAIAFDGNDTLIDGQHRLQAVVMSGCTVRMMVCINNAASFHDPIDRGAPRTLGQILGLTSKHVAALNTLRMLEAGCLIHSPMTTAEAEEIALHYRDDWPKFSGLTKLRGPVLGACVYTFPCAQEAVLNFARQVLTGEMIQRGDPAFALRNWLAGSTAHGGTITWDCAMATLNAVRYACAGQQLASIYMSPSGYRSITTQRRVLKVPHTPENAMVLTMQPLPTSRTAGRDKPAPNPVQEPVNMTWAAKDIGKDE